MFYRAAVLFELDQGDGFEACFRSEQIRSFRFQGAYLRPTTSINPMKGNLVINKTRH